jgi:hypothetical protein
VDVIPVRRDGTGRLVAVGLIEAPDTDGERRWTTIGGSLIAGEATDDAIGRWLKDALGPDVCWRFSIPPSAVRTEEHQRRVEAWQVDEAHAVDVSGRIASDGAPRRFSWFLVTSLPPRAKIASGKRTVLASFLEAQGERSLGHRLRQF